MVFFHFELNRVVFDATNYVDGRCGCGEQISMNVHRRVAVHALLTPSASTSRVHTSVSVQLASRRSQTNPTPRLSPAKVRLFCNFSLV